MDKLHFAVGSNNRLWVVRINRDYWRENDSPHLIGVCRYQSNSQNDNSILWLWFFKQIDDSFFEDVIYQIRHYSTRFRMFPCNVYSPDSGGYRTLSGNELETRRFISVFLYILSNIDTCLSIMSSEHFNRATKRQRFVPVMFDSCIPESHHRVVAEKV